MPSASLSINSTNVRRSAFLAWHRLHIAVATLLSREKAIATAARLFTTPPRYAHTPRELEFLATGTRFDVATPEGPIAAWRFGRGDDSSGRACGRVRTVLSAPVSTTKSCAPEPFTLARTTIFSFPSTFSAQHQEPV